MNMKGLQLFQLLKPRLGESEAEAFVTYVDDSRRDQMEDFRRIFATKEDLAILRGELGENLANVKGELEVKISDVKSDVVLWMFAFFITMLVAIIGLYFKK